MVIGRVLTKVLYKSITILVLGGISYFTLFFTIPLALLMAGVQKRKRNKMSKTTGQTSATKRPTLEMVLALASFIAGVLAKLSFEQVDTLLKNKNGLLRKKLQEVFEVALDPLMEVRLEWEKFYLDHFGITVDFSGIEIPKQPTGGSWRLIFVPKGLTLNATIVAMQKHFEVWVYTEDLDGNVPTNTRTSATSYAVWVQVGDEPDPEYLGQSTRTADMEGKIGITLLERLVLGLKYFIEIGKHLDIEVVTLCTGSRRVGGAVPGVYWYAGNGKVRVDLFDVDIVSAMCGLRQAVS